MAFGPITAWIPVVLLDICARLDQQPSNDARAFLFVQGCCQGSLQL
eukprot:CAMPEP_0197274144 /NCGR_PEP_ID=MMETSP1432-20130617/12270_1 /TAXON_ID=44447 /ORGANISM="Pseudo-nitzschia delicatissima, Strain UNC1205" /LENGTH=45 /DNA_ID= /DNA_START= /DNA_END= /DNA_ORIENTATION=